MKTLNFGSLNVDYVYDVPHFVQAGETLTALARNVFAGGKGLNQSIALARAGMKVHHAGCVGEDGGILLNALHAANINTDYVYRLDGQASGHTMIQVNQAGENCIVVYGGANHLISQTQIDHTLRGFGTGDYLVLQNEISNMPYLMRRASEQGMSIVLNPSPADEKINLLPLDTVRYLVVNEIEGALLAGTSVPEELLKRLRSRYPNMQILLTIGSAGAMFFDGVNCYKQPAYPVKTVDTTAAGDTFLGYFLAGVADGSGIAAALNLAARAASVAVSKKGASDSIPYRSQLEERI